MGCCRETVIGSWIVTLEVEEDKHLKIFISNLDGSKVIVKEQDIGADDDFAVTYRNQFGLSRFGCCLTTKAQENAVAAIDKAEGRG